MNRRPLSVDLGLLEPLDSLSEPMANTARKITAESLHARLPVENPHDEFDARRSAIACGPFTQFLT